MNTPRQARRTLPLLESVQVASPCSAEWSEMVGDDRVRFCGSCAKNVYNLSAMRAEDAEQLLAMRAGNDLCVRFYQRADGTMMTADCPVGVTRERRKKVAMAVAGAGALAFGALASMRQTQTTMGAPVPVTMGEVGVMSDPAPVTAPIAMGTVAVPVEARPPVRMGVVAVDPSPVEVQGKTSIAQGGVAAPQPPRAWMGRRSPPKRP